MSRQVAFRLMTDRDLEILTALDRCPLSTSQLLKLSTTFRQPFPSERRLRQRLQELCDAGRVRRWQYATAGRGAPNYYTLSKLGFRILHGVEAEPPSKRAFEAVHIANQQHTIALADFVVHTAVCAHRQGIAFTDYYLENALKLEIGDEALYPDAAWCLIDAAGQRYRFFLEIDGGTERVRSTKAVESWERKIRLYDAYQDRCPERFRVLCVSIRSTLRPTHVLEAAAQLVRNPQRSLVYATSLSEYLVQTDPLRSRCFCDHRGHPVSLLPRRVKHTRGLARVGPVLALA